MKKKLSQLMRKLLAGRRNRMKIKMRKKLKTWSFLKKAQRGEGRTVNLVLTKFTWSLKWSSLK